MLLSILTFLVGFQAFGAVMPFFKEDGSQASLAMLGAPTDPDAVALWNALKVPEEDFQGRLSKKLPVLNAHGDNVFDIDCIFSRMILNTGSCTMILKASPGMIEVNKSAGTARMWLTGAAAADLAAKFVQRDVSTVLFRSRDARLNISVARERGVITDLVVDWK
jgi:hypothetical protein